MTPFEHLLDALSRGRGVQRDDLCAALLELEWRPSGLFSAEEEEWVHSAYGRVRLALEPQILSYEEFNSIVVRLVLDDGHWFEVFRRR